MMKKISKIFIILILLFFIGITGVSAATFRDYREAAASTLQRNGMISYNWYTQSGYTHLCVNQGACKKIYDYFNLYSVEDEGSTYVLYCLNLSKGIQRDGPMNRYDSLDNIRFTDPNLSQDEKNKRIEMLKKLLLFGYNPNSTGSRTIQQIIASDSAANYKLIAMQILIWEVMEGGRTDFATLEPQYNAPDSFYQQVIRPNGDDVHDSLYKYYHMYRANALHADETSKPSAFNTDTYVLNWDQANRNYTYQVIGLGEYEKCSSDNPKVHVSDVSNSSVTITSSEPVANATITCRYFRGSGPATIEQGEFFRFYNFVNDTENRQDMIFGSGWRIYTNSFKVKSEDTDIRIKKVDFDEKVISKSNKFTLTHTQNTSYSKTIKGNGNAVNLVYSGIYRISETAPEGYEPIPNFQMTINAKDHRIDRCDGEQRDAQGQVIGCLNGQVKVAINNNVIELTVKNDTKTFPIKKFNDSNKPIAGATFQIKDSNNNVVKFTRSSNSNNTFKYDPAGTITSLQIASSSIYNIALLPAGEYKVIETDVPEPYVLPKSDEVKTTYIKVNNKGDVAVKNKSTNKYESKASVDIKNYITKVVVKKVGNGNSLEGVQFELYNKDKTEKIKTRVDAPGVYTYARNQASVDNEVYVTNSKGEIAVNSLPEGTYYFKEIATVPPYVLPTGDGVYTKVEIAIDNKGVTINESDVNNTIEISNSLNSFNFYKRDEDGNALTTGKYKLQKYDEEKKKYIDLKLKPVENDGTYNPNTDIYKVDNKDGNIQFTLTKGVATFIEMEPSTTYRIIETKAPEGYTKASINDTAIAHIDEYGNASGLLVLIDQKIVKEDDNASAELIINIQTGKQRIMYAAVIFVVIGAIVGLIVYNKKK